MHSICPVQKWIENYFLRVWWKSFSQRWQVQTKRVLSGKKRREKKAKTYGTTTCPPSHTLMKTFLLSLGD